MNLRQACSRFFHIPGVAHVLCTYMWCVPMSLYIHRFPFRRGGWALGVYLFAHPRFLAYIYACCCQRCSRCFAHTCHSSMLPVALLSYPPSRILPTHSCSPCTMRGSLAVGAGYPPLCKQRRLVLWGDVFSPEGHLVCTVILFVVVGRGARVCEFGVR